MALTRGGLRAWGNETVMTAIIRGRDELNCVRLERTDLEGALTHSLAHHY